jgi:hypothetical protein
MQSDSESKSETFINNDNLNSNRSNETTSSNRTNNTTNLNDLEMQIISTITNQTLANYE